MLALRWCRFIGFGKGKSTSYNFLILLIYSELSMASKEHNVSYLESGVYMIEVVTNSGTAFKKIIVN